MSHRQLRVGLRHCRRRDRQVQKFANMTDASKLGPYMVTAPLATSLWCGARHLICLPPVDELLEETNHTLIIDGTPMIGVSKTPALVREMLLTDLPKEAPPEEGEPLPA
jgi:chemotaxis protein MotA